MNNKSLVRLQINKKWYPKGTICLILICADLCGDFEDFVDDKNLFNVLEDVDMDLLGVGSDLSYENPENNFDFFIQDDQYNNPTSFVSSVEDSSPLSLSTVSTQPSPSSVPVQPNPQPARSSVIVLNRWLHGLNIRLFRFSALLTF